MPHIYILYIFIPLPFPKEGAWRKHAQTRKNAAGNWGTLMSMTRSRQWEPWAVFSSTKSLLLSLHDIFYVIVFLPRCVRQGRLVGIANSPRISGVRHKHGVYLAHLAGSCGKLRDLPGSHVALSWRCVIPEGTWMAGTADRVQRTTKGGFSRQTWKRPVPTLLSCPVALLFSWLHSVPVTHCCPYCEGGWNVCFWVLEIRRWDWGTCNRISASCVLTGERMPLSFVCLF